MPDNIIVLSESAILSNPICEKIFIISTIFIFLSLFLAFISTGTSEVCFIIWDIISYTISISGVFFIISLIGVANFPYYDTGYKEYTVIAQTEEQIKYIYENYDITGSNGDIYYIQERIE